MKPLLIIAATGAALSQIPATPINNTNLVTWARDNCPSFTHDTARLFSINLKDCHEVLESHFYLALVDCAQRWKAAK